MIALGQQVTLLTKLVALSVSHVWGKKKRCELCLFLPVTVVAETLEYENIFYYLGLLYSVFPLFIHANIFIGFYFASFFSSCHRMIQCGLDRKIFSCTDFWRDRFCFNF